MSAPLKACGTAISEALLTTATHASFKEGWISIYRRKTPPPHLTHTYTHYTPSLIPYQHPAIIQASAAHTCVRAEAILWPVTLKRESISISSLEKANWSRGPERRLHSDGPAVLMLRHTRAGRRSMGGVGREAERARTVPAWIELLCCRAKKRLPLYLTPHFPRRHHRPPEVGQLTWNNYEHLLLRC